MEERLDEKQKPGMDKQAGIYVWIKQAGCQVKHGALLKETFLRKCSVYSPGTWYREDIVCTEQRSLEAAA